MKEMSLVAFRNCQRVKRTFCTKVDSKIKGNHTRATFGLCAYWSSQNMGESKGVVTLL